MPPPVPAPRLTPPSVFLALALLFGLATLFATPPFQAPDEYDHFFRAFQLSDGILIGQKQGHTAGGQIPLLLNRVANTEGVPFHRDRKFQRAFFIEKLQPALVRWNASVPRAFIGFPHTVYYPPGGYLPQTLGIFLGRLAGVGPLGLMYLARLGGFLASVGLCYAGLRCLPLYRWTMLVFLLCPMSLFLLGSVAPDGLLISSMFLLVALAARAGLDPAHRVRAAEAAAIGGLLAVAVMAKVVYLPILAVVWVFVLPRLRSIRERIAFALASAAGGVLTTCLWARRVASLYTPGRTDIPLDAAAQLRHIEHAPGAFLTLVWHTISAEYRYRWYELIGVLGWLDTPLPLWYYSVFGYSALACIVFESRDAARVSGWQRLTLFAAAASSVLLNYAAQYVIWNSPASPTLVGVEGRYLLPLASLGVLAFPAIPGLRALSFCPPVIASFWCIVSGIVCLQAIIARFYLP